MNIESPKREYRQTARAAASEATRRRLIEAFSDRFRQSWFDEIRLEDVAADAGVTVQTVLRRFGSKEGLLEALRESLNAEVRQRRYVEPGNAAGAMTVLSQDYERSGDLVLRLLAQEDRYPVIGTVTDIGRAGHREWIATAFQPWLNRLEQGERTRALDALVTACDVYVWKLVRKDMGRSVSAYRALVERFCAAALAEPQESLFESSKEKRS